MTEGLLRARVMAAYAAGLAEQRGGERGQRIYDRLKNFFNGGDIEALEAFIAGDAMRALERMLKTEADIEETDPEALVLHECAACGASVPIAWTPPAT